MRAEIQENPCSFVFKINASLDNVAYKSDNPNIWYLLEEYSQHIVV